MLAWVLNLGFAAGGVAGVAPTITTTDLPDGQVGTAYNQTIAATGDSPITFAVSAGIIPSGLSLDASTGIISGIPSNPTAFNFTIEATNGTGSDDQAYTVLISPLSGGFWEAYADIAGKRKKRLKELLELEEQVQHITDETDREIAELIHESGRKEAEKAELERIRSFARQYNDARSKEAYGERVATALARASVQNTFSAAHNLLKEAQRALEEEEFAIRSTLLIIELT